MLFLKPLIAGFGALLIGAVAALGFFVPERQGPVVEVPRVLVLDEDGYPSADTFDYPYTQVVGFTLEGHWIHNDTDLDIVDEYLPTGAGPHRVVVELLDYQQEFVHEVEPGGQVYTIFGAVTVSPISRESIVAAPPITDFSTCPHDSHTYGPADGATYQRRGDCWGTLGIDPMTGCKTMSCNASGSECILIINSVDGSDEWGNEDGCVEMSGSSPQVEACPDGTVTINCLPCISGPNC